MCGAWSRNLLEQPKGAKALGQEQHGVFRGQQGKGWRPEFNQATVHSARQTERELDSEGTKEYGDFRAEKQQSYGYLVLGRLT